MNDKRERGPCTKNRANVFFLFTPVFSFLLLFQFSIVIDRWILATWYIFLAGGLRGTPSILFFCPVLVCFGTQDNIYGHINTIDSWRLAHRFDQNRFGYDRVVTALPLPSLSGPSACVCLFYSTWWGAAGLGAKISMPSTRNGQCSTFRHVFPLCSLARFSLLSFDFFLKWWTRLDSSFIYFW